MTTSIRKPIFIVAAPRSGSTLLFETLSASREFWTVGGEAHGIFEGIEQLRPGAPGVDSNRLTERHATDDVKLRILSGFLTELRDCDGRMLMGSGVSHTIRMLEKTPKNSLRIPFINAIFPDALFVFLYRDPRENMSSIMESWRSGGWVTYQSLPGWVGPWSLLLPPEWQAVKGKSLAEVAAFQWDSANRYILDDLEKLSADRWVAVDYADFLGQPDRVVKRICEAVGVKFDKGLRTRTAGELPLSRYTLTPPRLDKWKKNEGEIMPVLHTVLPTFERIQNASKNKPAPTAPVQDRDIKKIGRNEPCPCGSGKKYKRCHGA